MKTETLLFLILSALVLTVFLIPKLWIARNPDPLAARYRGLGVLILMLALVLATATIIRFLIPAAAPGGIVISVLASQLLVALFSRQRLAKRLHQQRSGVV